MKSSILAITVSSLFAIGVCGVSSADDQAPVDCSTAQQDIAHLQHEKKSTDERKMKGVFAIMPIGLVVNAVSSAGDKKDPNTEMHVDEYNKQIDERIAAIKKACPMDDAQDSAISGQE